MTVEKYKELYPRNSVFLQIDNDEILMDFEQYEKWVLESVYKINHDPLAP